MRVLLTSIAEIKDFIAIDIANNYDNLKPYIWTTQQAVLVPIFSKKFIEDMMDHHDLMINQTTEPGENETGTPEEQAAFKIKSEIVTLLNCALANLAYLSYSPTSNVRITESGFMQVHSGDYKPAFKWAVDKLEGSFEQIGYTFLDIALTTIDDNIEHFEEYKQSKEFILNRSLFVYSTKQFDEVFPIDNSRLVYLGFRRFLRVAEDKYIFDLLCAEAFSDLKELIASDAPLSEDEEILLDYVNRACVFYAVFEGIEKHGIRVLSKGNFFLNEKGISDNNQEATNPGKAPIDSQAKKALANGNLYLKKARDFIKNNPASFPTIIESDCYTQTVKASNFHDRDNTGKRIFQT